MTRAVLSCLLLVGCGPVLLGDERQTEAGVSEGDAAAGLGQLHILAEGCGCYRVTAEPSAGQPPYTFLWEDGSEGATRSACASSSLPVSVLVTDANAKSFAIEGARLEPSEAGCPVSEPLLCIANGSFEGTPAINLALSPKFEAPPWSACSNPSSTNTPDILNETIQQSITTLVAPTDGKTYLGLTENEQVSQPLCEAVQAGAERAVMFDVARVNINAGTAPETERIALQLWGGVASLCSRHELLWASPALEVGWKRMCVTLQPTQFMDQLTLRAASDNTQLNLTYLLVDNLVAVERCP